jgi:hypothetical protein
MPYHAGFSNLDRGSELQDSGLIPIIESPDNPVQIGFAMPTGKSSEDGQVLYMLCFFGDRRPVTGDWFLADGRFWSTDDAR